MADNYGVLGGWLRIDRETAYGTGGIGGSVSLCYRIAEGGDNLVRTVERQDSKHVRARSRAGIYDINTAAAGSITLDRMDYDTAGRFLQGILGGVESDSSSGAPYDNYYYCRPEATDTANLATWAIQIGRGGYTYLYEGCVFNSMTLSQSGGDELQITFDILAKQETSIGAYIAPTFPTGSPLKRSHVTATTICGDSITLGLVRDFTLTINNNLRADAWPLGSSGRAEPKRSQGMTVQGSVVMDWDNLVDTGSDGLLQLWRDATAGVTLFTWNNGGSTTAEREFVIYLPASCVDGDPVVGNNRGIIEATINFSGIDTDVSAADANLGGTTSGGTNAARTNQPIMMRLSNNEQASAW